MIVGVPPGVAGFFIVQEMFGGLMLEHGDIFPEELLAASIVASLILGMLGGAVGLGIGIVMVKAMNSTQS
jgi:hypothetical protein